MNELRTANEMPPLPSKERLVELMMDAARSGRDDMMPALLQAGVAIDARDTKGYTPLIVASYNGWDSATAILLDLGAEVDLADGGRRNTALMGVCFKGYRVIAERLIRAGADVNARNSVGQTALMMAALFGHAQIVELLLVAGADPSLTDEAGNSAASLSAAQGNDDLATRLTGPGRETKITG